MNGYDQIIGSTVDNKYRIDRLVDRGGMGAIYAATHVNLNRTVAVKLIRTDVLSHPTSLARFKREARMAARVEHPNAVTVYDFGSIDGVGAYLAMELVEGESLRALLKRRGALTLAEVVEIASQVGAVLGAAHRRDIVHRDVKPANILLRYEQGRPIVKLADFGIAKSVRAEETTQLTSPSEIVGTPSYMAPEQFSGEPIDGRTDLYALAAVVYEMLSGRCPFEGTLSEVIGKHLFAEPPSLPEADDDPVSEFLKRALAKSPAARPATAAEFVAELTEAAARRSEATGEELTLREQTIEVEPPFEETDRIPVNLVENNSFATGRPDVPEAARKTAPLPTVYVPSEPATTRVRVQLPAPAPERRLTSTVGPRAAAAAACVALAGLLVLGAGGVSSDGAGVAETPRPVAAAKVEPSVFALYIPAGIEAVASPESRKTEGEARRSRRTTIRRASSKQPRGDSGRKFVRVLRVDKHIGKIFGG